MKNMRFYIKSLFFLSLIYMVYISCKKNEAVNDSGVLTVDRVSAQNDNTIDSTITKAHLGTLIRIDGSGFSSLKAVYVNGVSIPVNPGYVSAHHILFTIPSDLPYGNDVSDTSARNQIRLVSSHGEYKFPFVVQGATPVITGVSSSLPAVGDNFEIYGTGLRDISKIEFPGGVTLDSTQFSTNDSTVISCVVPAGGVDSAGAIIVYSENGNVASQNFMNYRKGTFVNNFTADPAASSDQSACSVRPYNYGANITGTSSSLLPTDGQWTKNPDFYRQVPATAGSGAAVDFSGGFYFYSCAALSKVLNETDGDITVNTSCSALALQFDYYITGTWNSGYIRFEWINNSASWRYDYAPWALGAGVTKGVSMPGWHTLTIPLNSFASLNGNVSFGTFLSDVVGQGGKMMFVNSNYTDAGGNTYAASAMPDFSFSFGNFRIVPYSRPAVQNN